MTYYDEDMMFGNNTTIQTTAIEATRTETLEGETADGASGDPVEGITTESPEYQLSRRAPRPAGPSWSKGLLAAGLAAMIAVSGASGAGIAYWILDKNIAQSAGSSISVATPQINYTTVAAGSLAAADLTAAVAKAAGSVVEITTESKEVSPFARQYVVSGAGSGVILSADGYIVTNYHVIANANTITVRANDGVTHTAILIGSDEKTDLALLKVEAAGLIAAELVDSDQIQVGQVAIAIGNPLGELGGTVTDGIISAKDREITIDNQTMTLLQTSAAVSPGNSGGGLFDAAGRLVGVVNAKSTGNGVEGLSYAIPANTVKDVTVDLMEYGYVTGRPQLGISVREIADSRLGYLYGAAQSGVYITGVTENNGLAAGDRILSINGQEIAAFADIRSQIEGCSVGDTVVVTVERDGKVLSIDVVLTEQVPEHIRATLKAA